MGLLLELARCEQCVELAAEGSCREALVGLRIRADPKAMQMIRHEHIDRAGNDLPRLRVQSGLTEFQVTLEREPTGLAAGDGVCPKDPGISLIKRIAQTRQRSLSIWNRGRRLGIRHSDGSEVFRRGAFKQKMARRVHLLAKLANGK